jgi:hypothetical protein
VVRASPGNLRRLPDWAREILRINEVYESRQRVLITGSRAVADACEQAFQSLKEVRDVLGLGHDTDSPAFRAADDIYRAAVLKLDTVIRTDLAIPEPDLGSVTFARAETPLITAEIPPRPSPSPPEAQGLISWMSRSLVPEHCLPCR